MTITKFSKTREGRICNRHNAARLVDGAFSMLGSAVCRKSSLRRCPRCSRELRTCHAIPGIGQGNGGLRGGHTPYIVYSQNKKEIHGQDVALLLHTSREAYMKEGSQQMAGYFYHWGLDGFPGPRVVQKVTYAVEKSMAVVAAFTNTDVYYDEKLAEAVAEAAQASGLPPTQQQQRALSGSGASSSTLGDGVWPWAGSSTKRKRSLVGFARAAGDESLAATVYDVVVHPDFQNYGVGRKLLRVLVTQLYNKSVYDVGCLVPTQKRRFFSFSDFEDDREQSTTMTFASHLDWRQRGLVTGLLDGPAWLLAPVSLGQGAQDPLRQVPTPATDELKTNTGLQRSLRLKLDKALGPMSAGAVRTQARGAATTNSSQPTQSTGNGGGSNTESISRSGRGSGSSGSNGGSSGNNGGSGSSGSSQPQPQQEGNEYEI